MKISLCMILKNEAKTVEQAIRSVLPVIDEAVIGIDITTTDATKERVLSVLAKSGIKFSIDEFEFKNDFAKARNQFIEKCTGDYVLILDGHEKLDPTGVVYLQEFKRRDETELDVIDFTIAQRKTNGGVQLFQQPRMFKPFVRYSYAVHNTILHEENRRTMPQVTIWHNQPTERFKQRAEQRKKMNTKGLEKLANEGDVRAMFYLGNTYYEMQEWQKAINWYRRYLGESKFCSERYQAKLFLSICYQNVGEKALAEEVLLSCFEEGVPRNEHIVALGDLRFLEKNYEAAEYYYRLATSVPLPAMFLMIEQEFYTWLPWWKLALARVGQNNVDGALDAIREGLVRGPDIERFHQLEAKILSRVRQAERAERGWVYVVAKYTTFVEPLVREIERTYAIRFAQQFNPEHARNADVIWVDWADENALAVANYETKAKKILRIHSYEVFTRYVDLIDFEAFDHIVFVAEHIKEHWESRLEHPEWLKDRVSVIPIGVDLQKFQMPKKKFRTNKVAWAGYGANKKGVQLIPIIAREFPDFEFHVAIEWQEKDVEAWFKATVPENVIVYPWQKDLQVFFVDKSYVLSTSPRESFHAVVAQGMACGCKPLVFRWIGAEKVYQPEWTWLTFDELRDLLQGSWTPEVYREFIEKRYDQKKLLKKLICLVDQKIKEKKNVIEV